MSEKPLLFFSAAEVGLTVRRVEAMKFGIHYIYWRNDLKCRSYTPYVERAKKSGFDVLEIGDYLFLDLTGAQIEELAAAAREYDVELALGLDPPQDAALSDDDPAVREKGIRFYSDIFPKLNKLGIKGIGGNMLNAPFRPPFSDHHQREWANAVLALREICRRAADCGLQVNCEIVNRYEGHIANTAKDARKLLDEVGLPNAKMTLDSFHMNVEESSFANAIFDAGDRLGHFHLEENHRGLLGTGHLPLYEIRDALRKINYQGILTMESLVRAGGELGDCARIWRDLTGWADEETLDRNAKASVESMRYLFSQGTL